MRRKKTMNRLSNQVQLTGMDKVRQDRLMDEGKLKFKRLHSTGCLGCDDAQEQAGCLTAMCAEHDREYMDWTEKFYLERK
jgi:hypothetical protein